MSIIDILLKISPALEAGKSLENSGTWNNVATTTHILIIVFGFVLLLVRQGGYDVPISDDQIAGIAGAVASVGGTVNLYLHHATNKNLGIRR